MYYKGATREGTIYEPSSEQGQTEMSKIDSIVGGSLIETFERDTSLS